MTRRYLPEGELLAAALAGRVDAIERATRETSTDVAALGRGLADLTTQIRHLTTHTGGGSSPPASSGADAGEGDGDGGDQGEGQRDWYTVTDPDTARAWLAELIDTTEAVLTYHGVRLDVACWALHPDVVTDLLALAAERDTAYTGPRPTPVSEWLTRWLPAATERISTALAGCVAERGHRHGPHTYDTTGFDPLSAATWWALERHIPAPEAFALPIL